MPQPLQVIFPQRAQRAGLHISHSLSVGQMVTSYPPGYSDTRLASQPSGQGEEDLLELLHVQILLAVRLDQALPQAGRDDGEPGPVQSTAHSRELGDDVLTAATLLEHPHDTCQLALGPLQAVDDLAHVRRVELYRRPVVLAPEPRRPADRAARLGRGLDQRVHGRRPSCWRCHDNPSGRGLVSGHLRTDVVHVQRPSGTDELLERGPRKRSGLGEHQDVLSEDHQRRDGSDARLRRQHLLGLCVHLAEHDVGVLLRRRLEDGGEHTARPAPGSPEVDQDDVVVLDGLLERVDGQIDDGHGCSSTPSGYPRGYQGTPLTGNQRCQIPGTQRWELRTSRREVGIPFDVWSVDEAQDPLKEDNVKKNIGSIDRTIRTILAPVLVVVGVLVGPGGWLAIVLYALAAILLATAAVSTCPLCMPFGLSTRPEHAAG